MGRLPKPTLVHKESYCIAVMISLGFVWLVFFFTECTMVHHHYIHHDLGEYEYVGNFIPSIEDEQIQVDILNGRPFSEEELDSERFHESFLVFSQFPTDLIRRRYIYLLICHKHLTIYVDSDKSVQLGCDFLTKSEGSSRVE